MRTERRLSPESQQVASTMDTVLSVDDNERSRCVRRHILEAANFRVVEAADGATALRLAETEAPSLVLLDIRLRTLAGFNVCEQLKSNPKTGSIPVVLISALGSMEADLAASLRRHSDAYLREPVDPETLVSVIRALIRAQVSERNALQAQESYRQVVESELEGIWTLDKEGTILFVNRRLAEMLQYTPDEIVGLHAWDLVPCDEQRKMETFFGERIATDASERVDVPLRRRDGSIAWFSGAGKNSYDSAGEVVQRTAVFIDVTERKQAQDALLENHDRLELALGAAELGTWEVDVNTGAVSASPLICAMFGLDSAGPQLEEWLARIHPDHLAKVREAIHGAMAGAPYNIEFQVVAPDGVARWIHSKARLVRDSQGRMTRLLGVAQDVTQRVRERAARDRQRELLQTIVENIPVMLCIYDPSLRTFQMNREFERVLGWNSADTSAGDFLEMGYPDTACRAQVTAHMESVSPGWQEFRTTAKNGEEIPCEWANIRLSDDRRVGIGIDLRQRKAAEESLRRSEASLRARAAELQAIMDALPVATFVARDPDCRDVIGSRATYELLRLAEGTNVSLSAPEDRAGWRFRFERDGREIPADDWPAQRAATTGEEVRDYEFDVAFDDGARRNMLGHAVPLLDEDSRPTGAVAAFLDITDRKVAEERFRQSQKLESLGVLAGGIAHDFNNLLTAIMGNTSMVMEEVGPGPARRLKSILQSAERAANLIRQLLAYSGRAEVTAREVDVAQALSEMRGLMELSVPRSVRFHLDIEQRLPLLRMDPSQLEQVIMNLVINAGEAICEGAPGQIRITASKTTVREGFTDALGSQIAAGRFVRIEVSDSGGGIDPKVMAKLFDPFFSTKFAGRGLGLASVAGIVRSSRGGITVESGPEKGTTFRVLLPVGSTGSEPKEEVGGRHKSVILVVDDDDCVREFIAAAGRRRGYRVLSACDGADALSICERRRVDAVVLDVVMPIMGANVLLPEIRQRQPHARILLTSGYSESDARRLCAVYPDTAFLQKPYTFEQIGDAIAKLVGAEIGAGKSAAVKPRRRPIRNASGQRNG